MARLGGVAAPEAECSAIALNAIHLLLGLFPGVFPAAAWLRKIASTCSIARSHELAEVVVGHPQVAEHALLERARSLTRSRASRSARTLNCFS